MYNMDLAIIRKISETFFKNHVIEQSLGEYEYSQDVIDKWTSIMIDVFAGVEQCVTRGDISFVDLVNEKKQEYLISKQNDEIDESILATMYGGALY